MKILKLLSRSLAVLGLLLGAGIALAQETNAPTAASPASGLDLNVFTAMWSQFAATPANLLLILAISVLAWLYEIIPQLNSRYVPHFCVGAGALLYPFLADRSGIPGSYPHPVVVMVLSGIIVGAIAAVAHKPLMKKLGVITALTLVALLGLTGGCTVLRNADAAEAIAQRAAYRIAQQVLRQHPEWRVHFERARDELVALQAQPRLDLLAVIEIIDRLPEDALGADGAWIVADAATLTIFIVGDPALKPESEAQVRAAVSGLIAGLNRHLQS